MSVFPTLDYLQIETRYPKAVKKVQDWLFEQEELKGMTKDFVDPKNPEDSKRQFTGMLIQMDPRKLYDIFDALNILVVVDYEPITMKWQYWVHIPNILSESKYDNLSSNRIQAEQTAFHDAFEELEKTL